MEINQNTHVTIVPTDFLERMNRDIYHLRQLTERLLEQRSSSVVVEWRPLDEFLAATCWKKTRYYEKIRDGKLPENLVIRRGRKIFVHSSAFDRFFAGDFD